jgi:hypothetical protein
MDSFVHCRNIEAKVENEKVLEKARNIAREMYVREVEHPYDMENLLNRLKTKESVRYRSKTTEPIV